MGNLWIDGLKPAVARETLSRNLGQRPWAVGRSSSVGLRHRFAGAPGCGRGLGLLGQRRQLVGFDIVRIDVLCDRAWHCGPVATRPRPLRIDFLRSRRTCLPLLWLIRWDEPHRLWLTLPLAETLNRFFIPLWVFSLGMFDTFLSVQVVSTESHGRDLPGHDSIASRISR